MGFASMTHLDQNQNRQKLVLPMLVEQEREQVGAE
jgi:hypothetical protein